MDKIYECNKCGAHHFSTEWDYVTYKVSSVPAQEYSIGYCPTCEQVCSTLEADFLSNFFEARLWPYHLSKEEILDQYPVLGKWL